MADVCGNCRFWCKGTNQPRNKESFTDEGGECRKYPPQPHEGSGLCWECWIYHKVEGTARHAED